MDAAHSIGKNKISSNSDEDVIMSDRQEHEETNELSSPEAVDQEYESLLTLTEQYKTQKSNRRNKDQLEDEVHSSNISSRSSSNTNRSNRTKKKNSSNSQRITSEEEEAVAEEFGEDSHIPVDSEDELVFNNASALFGSSSVGNDNDIEDRAQQAIRSRIAQFYPEMAHYLGALSSNHGEISNTRQIVNVIEAREDPQLVLDSLTELSEKILFGDTSMEVASSTICRALVGAMSEPSFAENLQIQLLACRCMYNLWCSYAEYGHQLIAAGAIEAIKPKLFEVSYIDLTEQCLQTFEALSKANAFKFLEKDALSACLQFIDFLNIHSQRKALNIAANCCKVCSDEFFPLINEVFPTIKRIVMDYSDTAALEYCFLSVSGIMDNVCEENVNSILTSDLLIRMFEIIVSSLASKNSKNNHDYKYGNGNTNGATVNIATVYKFFTSLTAFCRKSSKMSLILINDCEIGSFFNSTLNNSSIESLMEIPKELLIKILDLIVAVLPLCSKLKSLNNVHQLANFYDVIEGESIETNKSRIDAFQSKSKSIESFYNKIFPLMINIYSSTVDFEIRRKVILAIVHMICTNQFESSILLDGSKTVILTNWLTSIIIQAKNTVNLDLQEDRIIKIKKVIGAFGASVTVRKHVNNYIILMGAIIVINELCENYSTQCFREFEKEGLLDNVDLLSKAAMQLSLKESKYCGESSGQSNDVNGLPESATRFLQSLARINRKFNDESDFSNSDFNLENFKDDEFFQSLVTILEKVRKEYNVSAESKEEAALSKKQENIVHLLTNCNNNSYEVNDWISVWQDLDVYFGDNDSRISSFELISHGISDAMLKALSTNDLCYKTFVSYFLENPEKHESFKYLVRKLQEGLSRVESFEILTAGASQVSFFGVKSSGSSASTSSKAYSMARQLNIKLNFEDTDDLMEEKGQLEDHEEGQRKFRHTKPEKNAIEIPEEYKKLFISTHAIATFRTIHNFLKRRILLTSAFGDINMIINSDEDDQEYFDGQEEIDGEEEDEEDEYEISEEYEHEDNENVDVILDSNGESDEDANPDYVDELSGVDSIGVQNIHKSKDDLKSKKSHLSSKKADSDEWYFEFLINGEVIPLETTIYGAIYRNFQTSSNSSINPNSIWRDSHPITFRIVRGSIPDLTIKNEEAKYIDETTDSDLIKLNDDVSLKILNMLKLLFKMNYESTHISADEEFINWKVCAKLNRQLEEPLMIASGTLPSWSIHITREFAFLFPLSTKITFMESTSFGYSRLIEYWKLKNKADNGSQPNDGRNSRFNDTLTELGRQNRHKIRIDRSKLFESGLKLVDLYASKPSVLEIKYFDEVGSGLGPTLEFYSLFSHEFTRNDLKLWRNNDYQMNSSEFIFSSGGLFPSPNSSPEKTELFRILGKFIARSLLDKRMVDFHFNKCFFEIANFIESNKNKNFASQFGDLNSCIKFAEKIDPHLGKSLSIINELFDKDDEAALSELSITYTLPGYPSISMIDNGQNIDVTLSNCESYIKDVINYTIGDGVHEQIQSFVRGFSQVFPYYATKIFTSEEYVEILGNSEEDWSFETLSVTIKANHGYNSESKSIVQLYEIMESLTLEERKKFLQFMTGAPKLPIGGFKALTPEFTVVKKQSEYGHNPDEYLPSVMTCANYLKLPEYSSKSVMRQRILQSINEGRGAFLLS